MMKPSRDEDEKQVIFLLSACMTFSPSHFAHAGLAGEQLGLSHHAYISNGEVGPARFRNSATLIVQEPFSGASGVVIDDTTISFAPIDFFGPAVIRDRVDYLAEATDGSFPELDWATLATAFPDFDAANRLTQCESGFRLDFTGLPAKENHAFSISTLNASAGDDPAAAPEPPMAGLMLAGWIAFPGYRRQTEPASIATCRHDGRDNVLSPKSLAFLPSQPHDARPRHGGGP